MIIGKTTDENLVLTNKAVAEALTAPPVKMHCSVLAEQAVKKALYDYYQSEGLMTPEREKLFKILEEDEH